MLPNKVYLSHSFTSTQSISSNNPFQRTNRACSVTIIHSYESKLLGIATSRFAFPQMNQNWTLFKVNWGWNALLCAEQSKYRGKCIVGRLSYKVYEYKVRIPHIHLNLGYSISLQVKLMRGIELMVS